MGKGSLPRNSTKKIWWVIEPYFNGGSSFAFVKTNVAVHQKECITFILCYNYFCVKYFGCLCVWYVLLKSSWGFPSPTFMAYWCTRNLVQFQPLPVRVFKLKLNNGFLSWLSHIMTRTSLTKEFQSDFRIQTLK